MVACSLFDGQRTQSGQEPYGIYLHIPFCARKCPYCDFYSRPASSEEQERFVDALCSQAESFSPVFADTVYFGGGTPSLLTPQQIARILAALRRRHRIAPDAEITMECNPASATPQTLAAYRAAGVNRLSLGCQSFQPKTLAALGRTHTAEQAKQTFWDARRAGFSNISVDLMLGIPYGTPQQAALDAETAAALGADHVSAYLLKIAPGTPFASGVEGLPDEDTQAACYEAVSAVFQKAGYRHYEISNFCKEGCASRHNLKYWRCGRWLGLGPSAHMSDGNARFSCPASLSEFLSVYGQGAVENPLAHLQPQGEVDAEEFLIMALRTDEGLCTDTLAARFGVRFSQQQQNFLRRCSEQGLVELSENRIRLTERGFLLSNAILVELI